MADTKFLDYAGLAYFKEKLDTEYETKISDAIEVALPTPDEITITADQDNVWSAKLPDNGAITSDANGLKLDLTKIAGNTLEVSSNKLEVVVDGTTIKKGTPDINTGKTALEVDIDGLIDNNTIINNNNEMSVNLTNISDGDTIIVDGNGKLAVDPTSLDIPDEYTLPAASASTRGGIKVGNGLEVVDDGNSNIDKLQAKAANDTITINSSGIKVTDGKFAPLTNGTIPGQYLPSYVDDVIEGYYVPGDSEAVPPTEDTFYLTRTEVAGSDPVEYTYSDPVTPDSSKIYVDLTDGSADTYRWSGSTYVNISGAAIDIITNAEIDALFPAEEETIEP